MVKDKIEVYRSFTDEQLAVACGKRPVDEDAWRVFHNRFYDYVWRQIAGRLGIANDETDDIVQNVFIKTFQSMPSYDPRLSKVKTYLSKVIGTCIVDHIRRVSGQESASIEADLRVLQAKAAKDGDVVLLVADHIVSRVEDERTVEIMRDILDGQEAKRISTERGVSLSHVYEIRGLLRKLLSELRDDARSTG
jgi:RNA polymerase sigma factor (sigma-70 family)